MEFPHYSGFFFSHKNSPLIFDWHVCKEDAGRLIASNLNSNYPKSRRKFFIYDRDYVSEEHEAALQSYLDGVAKSFKAKGEIKVKSINASPHCLRIIMPATWQHNRITVHLLLTHIRKFFKNEHTADAYHLSSSSKLIRYAQRLGLGRFNVQMRRINKHNSIMGICAAKARMN